MSLNCNEIDLILKELDLTGSFIQEIVQPSFDSIALYTYKPGVPKTVFICLAAGECRLNEVKRKIPKNEKPLRFNEILRSRIKGAKITECRQLGKERIIKISTYREGPVYVMPAAQEKFAKKKKIQTEEDGIEELNLYIRLWSNAGNIFLCNKENVIFDSFYRRPAKGELSGEILVLPEIKNLTDLMEKEKLEEEKLSLQKFPVRDFNQIQNSSENLKGLKDKKNSGQTSKELSFNEKVDLFYSQNASRTSTEKLLEQAEKWYNSHKTRLENALEKLEQKRSDFLNAEQWKHWGDLILSYSYMFTNGQASSGYLDCEDFENGKKVHIKIDQKKSAHENAAKYYETYKKQSHGLEDLEHDILLSKKQISELDQKYNSMHAEKNPVKLEQLLRKQQKPRQQEQSERPGLSYESKGWTILVGRDATENDELLRHYVKGADLWFHTRDYPGGYVFIKARSGKTVPLEIMLTAGNLAVYYSKARKNAEADLYYTQVKHLRRAKNGPKGLVLPSNEKNLHIKMDSAILRQLEENQSEF